jgi:hypothetical protein
MREPVSGGGTCTDRNEREKNRVWPDIDLCQYAEACLFKRLFHQPSDGLIRDIQLPRDALIDYGAGEGVSVLSC